MATDAIEANATTVVEPPYRASWIDRLITGIHGLPWPAPVTYAVACLAFVVIANSQNWLSGAPLGTFTFTQTFWGVFTIVFLAALDYLNVVAGQAFDTFRPAISPNLVDEEGVRYELTTMSARAGLVILIACFPFTLVYYVSDPVASQIVGLSPVALAARWVFESFFSALLLCLVVHAFRQLRLVSRLHAVADRLDPFRPAPLYAFSRLTAQTGAALIAVGSLGVAVNPQAMRSETFVTLWLPWLVGLAVVAILIFVVPLVGMHGRLATLKVELQAAADARLKVVLGELNRDVDALDLARSDGLQKTLASLVQQREILARLPTWPWSAGTLRGFSSALLLPLVIFLLQRLLAGVVLTA